MAKKKLDLVQNTQVVFDSFTHTYTMGDKVLIGVTTLLRKHGLAVDYSDVDPEKLEKAAERGTAIHNLLEDYDNGQPVVETPELKAYKKLKLKVDCSEYLISDNDIVGSSIDKVLSDCSLGDVKTYSKENWNNKDYVRAVTWQLSIYAYLFERQNPGRKVPHIYAIYVRGEEARLKELQRIADSEIERLLECERKGERFYYEEHVADIAECLGEESLVFARRFLELEQMKAAMKAAEETIANAKEQLYAWMDENHIDTVKIDGGLIARKASTTRRSIDSARLKKEKPSIYEKYIKETPVKGSLYFKNE